MFDLNNLQISLSRSQNFVAYIKFMLLLFCLMACIGDVTKFAALVPYFAKARAINLTLNF